MSLIVIFTYLCLIIHCMHTSIIIIIESLIQKHFLRTQKISLLVLQYFVRAIEQLLCTMYSLDNLSYEAQGAEFQSVEDYRIELLPRNV